jgi:hypothetical protein
LVGIAVARADAVAGPVADVAGVRIGDPAIGLSPGPASDHGERADADDSAEDLAEE